jgi:hypothetical protein
MGWNVDYVLECREDGREGLWGDLIDIFNLMHNLVGIERGSNLTLFVIPCKDIWVL